ncbi:MAG: zinc ABC transporter substrate-binding protein [Bacilli bacterium]|nr:zinc ABC transporter substrate-binding protein [Bacilli bacterium]
MKKIITAIISLLLLITITGCNTAKKDNKLTILTSNFPSYDFARAITKDVPNTSVEMLLKPGTEMHNYEPTPKDIIKISKSDIFIYVGGESDEWIDDLLDNIDTKKVKVIKLMDLVNTVEEETVEGMQTEEEEEEKEYDEHVWTSPKNAIKIVNSLKDEIIKLDKDNSNLYEMNSNIYINELNSIDSKIRIIVENSSRKELIFADRFPFRYLADEYDLKYYAAFPGCSSETEASAKTISFLINKVKEDNIPVILTIEFSNKKIANTISKETGAKILELNSAHNISEEDFNNGKTYVDIMNDNIDVLKEALQ